MHNEPFKHFVITRFNLRNFRKEHKDYDTWVDWTNHRVPIFINYCLTSMRRQSNQSFHWLIYLDQTTPEYILMQLKEALGPTENIEFKLVAGYQEFESDYLKDVNDLVTKDSKWIVITRLDNDDILHKNAIQVIQENLVFKDDFIISLSLGFTYDLQTHFYSKYYYPNGPFLTKVEKNNGQKLSGVFNFNHFFVPSLHFSIRQELRKSWNNNAPISSLFYVEKPMWIQIIHGTNVSNKSVRGLPVFKRINLNDFGTKLGFKAQQWHSIIKHRNQYWWSNYLKLTLFKFLKR